AALDLDCAEELNPCTMAKMQATPALLPIVQGKFACHDLAILQRPPNFTWKINNKAGRTR
ncbi:hypothetical protein, partial [Pseudomonas sp. GM84]|uniref:hypothetical protein n=1 Tax=Pseudomonas sp. GM84 TaxID=1144340 RepID=UPI001EE6849A